MFDVNRNFDFNFLFCCVCFISFAGKYIPSSQRPDGTWRKARRVKDGYVPQEEVPLYESKGKQFMKKPAIPVGMCPLVAQEAKAHRERLQLKTQLASNAGFPVLPNSNNPNLNKKTSNTNKSQIESSKSSKSSATTTTKSKNKTKKSGSAVPSNVDVNALNDAVNSLSVTNEDDIAKKLKKLRKKIREIESIEERLTSGELKNPEQDQLDKIARKPQIVDDLKALELLETN